MNFFISVSCLLFNVLKLGRNYMLLDFSFWTFRLSKAKLHWIVPSKHGGRHVEINRMCTLLPMRSEKISNFFLCMHAQAVVIKFKEINGHRLLFPSNQEKRHSNSFWLAFSCLFLKHRALFGVYAMSSNAAGVERCTVCPSLITLPVTLNFTIVLHIQLYLTTGRRSA